MILPSSNLDSVDFGRNFRHNYGCNFRSLILVSYNQGFGGFLVQFLVQFLVNDLAVMIKIP